MGLPPVDSTPTAPLLSRLTGRHVALDGSSAPAGVGDAMGMHERRGWLLAGTALLLGVAGSGCERQDVARIGVDVSALHDALTTAPVDALVLRVSAPDLLAALVVQAAGSAVTLDVAVPPGPRRAFELEATHQTA